MNCRKVRQKLTRYIDDELSSKERERMSVHLKECNVCDRAFDRLRNLGLILKINVPKAPVYMTPRIMSQAQERFESNQRKNWLSRLLAYWLVTEGPIMLMATVLALIIGLAFGSVLGWHTHHRSNEFASFQAVHNMDLEVYYHLDFLGDTPAGSIEQVCLTVGPCPSERR